MKHARSVARFCTEVFQPPAVVSFLLIVAGIRSSTGSLGIWCGVIAALFMCLMPWLAVVLLARRGRLSDHHVGDKRQRLPVLLATLGSTVLGSVILVAMGAPSLVFAVLVSFVAGMVFMMAVSPFWKVSGHATALSGAVAVLILIFGPGFFWLLALPPLIGWSRVHLGDHSVNQVFAGTIAGPLVIGSVLELMTL
jgi:hypothetical protein